MTAKSINDGLKGSGTSSVVVRVSIEDAAAFIWNFDSRANVLNDKSRQVREGDDTKFRKVVTWSTKVKSFHGVNHPVCEFTNVMTMHRLAETQIVVLMKPMGSLRGANEERVSNDKEVVEGEKSVGFMLTAIGAGKTKVEYAMEVELPSGYGTLAPKTAKVHVQSHLQEPAKLLEYFLKLRGIETFDDEDGRHLANIMLWARKENISGEGRKERIANLLKNSRAMREFTGKYAWWPSFFLEATNGRMHLNFPVRTKLDCLSKKDAVQLARNLMPSLKARKTAEAGVHQWSEQNKAIKELFKRHEGVEELIIVLSKGIVRTAAWGLFWRVTVSAMMSSFDLVTDIIVTVGFFQDGRSAYGLLSLGCVVLCVFCQLLIVHMQRRNGRFIYALGEAFVVVIGLKAPLDAYRIAMGQKKGDGAILEPILELSFVKVAELFSEAIPGTIIQLTALLTNPNKVAKMQLFSLVVSVLTAGFTSAQISYDFDTDAIARKMKPTFYGYVPDLPMQRTLLFVNLVLFSSAVLVTRSLAVVLMFLQSPVNLSMFLGLDMALLFSVKFLRDDFTYWLPVYGWTGAFMTILCRGISKVVVDFTGIVQLRHPNELGGFMYTFSLLTSVVGLCVALYEDEGHQNSDGGDFDGDGSDDVDVDLRALEMTRLGGGIAIASALFFFGTMVKLMKSEYRNSFFSAVTGPEMTCSQFLDSTDDFTKADAIFHNNVHHWITIEDDAAHWVDENWDRWRDEQPDWLTDDMKKLIPIDWIPDEKERKRLSAIKLEAVTRRAASDRRLGRPEDGRDGGGGGLRRRFSLGGKKSKRAGARVASSFDAERGGGGGSGGSGGASGGEEFGVTGDAEEKKLVERFRRVSLSGGGMMGM
jgi:hypothetical protein